MSAGGSYTANEEGDVTLVERTQNHPGGNRPRDAEGKPINREQQPQVEPPRQTTKKGKE